MKMGRTSRTSQFWNPKFEIRNRSWTLGADGQAIFPLPDRAGDVFGSWTDSDKTSGQLAERGEELQQARQKRQRRFARPLLARYNVTMDKCLHQLNHCGGPDAPLLHGAKIVNRNGTISEFLG
jgi:hypothetical protein